MSVQPILGVTQYQPDKAMQGYTLFGHSHEGASLGRDLWGYVLLIDMQGNVVHRWRTETAQQLMKLQPDGSLLYSTRDRSRASQAGLRRLAPDSSLLWYYRCRIDHDFWMHADGRILIHTITDHMDPRFGHELRRHPYLVEIGPDKELLWEWHGEEHVDDLVNLGVMDMPYDWHARAALEAEQRMSWDRSLQNASSDVRRERQETWAREYAFDWAHNNTSQVIGPNAADHDARFRPGNIVFSYRTIDIIGVIDRATGEIVWAWGPGQLDGQHKPHMLPNGRILIYDNGTRRGWSRVIEVNPLTDEIEWEYAAPNRTDFYSPAISGAQRLANGHTFICEGNRSRLFEVTSEGEIVWEFKSPYRGFIDGHETHAIYRATRYTPEYVAPLLINHRDSHVF